VGKLLRTADKSNTECPAIATWAAACPHALAPCPFPHAHAQDFVLARLWTAARTLRIADGPDEVHLITVAKLELARARGGRASRL